ncbi:MULTISPECIES: hypothetical protein [unclassified Micromonospora]|uniref:hypothetical protein n=1 Tax=unclassified Micromonospora TaxID=2617518 RepID=UPI001B36A287|nr:MULTISPECIES: hypothetical protein [unclassified Micromonospora]MBQ1042432.1 hypothetical protein [Micromonospora sp. C72]MBQ1055754.1 hypothetical protein [Micromonospora sp. C32]
MAGAQPKPGNLMHPEQRAERAGKYFAPEPSTPVAQYVKLAFGGGLLLMALVMFAVGDAAICLGFLCGVGGAVLVVLGLVGLLNYAEARRRAYPRATDQEMDAWLYGAEEAIAQMGYRRLNIHPTELAQGRRPYLVFYGIPELFSVLPFHWNRGRDGKLRYSAYKIMIVYMSNWRLPVYECVLDIATGATIRDSTKEYALGNVDGMETSADRVSVFNEQWKPGSDGNSGGVFTGAIGNGPNMGAQFGHYTQRQIIKLLVSGRLAVDLWLGIAPNEAMVIQGVTEPSSVDAMISQLREHLREHSGAAYPDGNAALSGPAVPSGADPTALLMPPPSEGHTTEPIRQRPPGEENEQRHS